MSSSPEHPCGWKKLLVDAAGNAVLAVYSPNWVNGGNLKQARKTAADNSRFFLPHPQERNPAASGDVSQIPQSVRSVICEIERYPLLARISDSVRTRANSVG
jgi:hypothetical protein